MRSTVIINIIQLVKNLEAMVVVEVVVLGGKFIDICLICTTVLHLNTHSSSRNNQFGFSNSSSSFRGLCKSELTKFGTQQINQLFASYKFRG